MFDIDWQEYKFHKMAKFSQEQKKDNFAILIDFLRARYMMTSVHEIFDTIRQDELGMKMLVKREIANIENFENYLYGKKRA